MKRRARNEAACIVAETVASIFVVIGFLVGNWVRERLVGHGDDQSR